MSIDIERLTECYFSVDSPVSYKLKCGNTIDITPITVKDSNYFLRLVPIITINKNEISSAEIISMSYLQFLVEFVFKQDENSKLLLGMILQLCCNLQSPRIIKDEKGKYALTDDNDNVIITTKEFDEIRTIIVHQNIYNYDDSYINPELKKAMDEVDKMRNSNIEPPTLERKIAIISSHTGITKNEQLKMTIRSHQCLFDEVCAEVEFATTRPIALYSGQKIDHWIFKKRKNKLDGYATSVSDYNKSMGGTGEVLSATSGLSDSLINQYNNF